MLNHSDMNDKKNYLTDLIKRTNSSDPEVAKAAKEELQQQAIKYVRGSETRLAGVNAERR